MSRGETLEADDPAMSDADAGLFEPIAREDLEGVKAALAAGADPNAADRWGATPLAKAVARGRPELVDCLLGHGAEADRSDGAGNSPLMQACARGHVEIVRALLAAGADPEGANKWGFGPRDWSSWSDKAGEIQALLREGRG